MYSKLFRPSLTFDHSFQENKNESKKHKLLLDSMPLEHQNETPEKFIIFLGIDYVLHQGSLVQHESEELAKQYLEEKGYTLKLLALKPSDRTKDLILTYKGLLETARKDKAPILIKLKNNRFIIYGDKTGQGFWCFTKVNMLQGLNLDLLPFARGTIERRHKLFTVELSTLLQQGHAQKTQFYADYIYKQILNDYAYFRARTHFFDKAAVTHLNNLIHYIKAQGIDVGIVPISSWREFFEKEHLKTLFSHCTFSEYILDKLYDSAAVSFGMKKFDLFLVQLSENARLSKETKRIAKETATPILIKRSQQFYCYGLSYGALEEWKINPIVDLSLDEQQLLDNLSFDKPCISADALEGPLVEIIKKWHLPETLRELKPAESIELWLQQNPSYRNFIIIDGYDDGLSELFPQHFVRCQKYLTAKEYQSALQTVDELLNLKLPAPKRIYHQVNPFVKKTWDDSRAPNLRLFDVSMPVLKETRTAFLHEQLSNKLTSPLPKKNLSEDQIAKLILDYDKPEVELRDWIIAQKWLLVLGETGLIAQSCLPIIVEYVMNIELITEHPSDFGPLFGDDVMPKGWYRYR
jgi:hypothetical protein